MDSLRKNLLALSIGAALCIAPHFARGAPIPCAVDTDCPDTACGGQVCKFPDFVCAPAGSTGAQGQDGWCHMSTDCKCMSEGATCQSTFFCTFTLPGGNADMSTQTSGDLGTSAHDMASTQQGADMQVAPHGGTQSSGCSMAETRSSPALFGLLLVSLAVALSVRRRRDAI